MWSGRGAEQTTAGALTTGSGQGMCSQQSASSLRWIDVSALTHFGSDQLICAVKLVAATARRLAITRSAENRRSKSGGPGPQET